MNLRADRLGLRRSEGNLYEHRDRLPAKIGSRRRKAGQAESDTETHPVPRILLRACRSLGHERRRLPRRIRLKLWRHSNRDRAESGDQRISPPTAKVGGAAGAATGSSIPERSNRRRNRQTGASENSTPPNLASRSHLEYVPIGQMTTETFSFSRFALDPDARILVFLRVPDMHGREVRVRQLAGPPRMRQPQERAGAAIRRKTATSDSRSIPREIALRPAQFGIRNG